MKRNSLEKLNDWFLNLYAQLIFNWINKKTLSNYFINIMSNYAIEKEKEENDKKLFFWKSYFIIKAI